MTVTTSKTSKGEQTKSRIIDTTLDIIYESGLAAVSYRNIADKAKIRHSLTTYHFGSIDNLMCQAFDRFEQHEWLFFESLLAETSVMLSQYKQNNDSEALIQTLTEGLTEYTILSHSGERKRQSTIESQFIFSLNVSEELSQRVRRYNQKVLDAMADMLYHLGSKSAEIHANMLLSTVRYFELANATGHLSVDRDIMRHALNVQIRTIFEAN